MDEKIALQIKLIYIGRDSKNHYRDAESLYLKRISRYFKNEIIAIKPGKYSKDHPVDLIQKEEAEKIEKQLSPSDQVVLLDERGQDLDSHRFAKLLDSHKNRSTRHLVFVIGGAYGLQAELKKKYKNHIRLSSLTFPHHLARAVLSEQIYRACSILNNEPYHNN